MAEQKGSRRRAALSRRAFLRTAAGAALSVPLATGAARNKAEAKAGTAATPERLNVILLISDTFRRDHLGCYGCDWIHTPNLDKFAADAVVFDHAYTGSYATVPCRKDVMTGRWVFPWTGWSPLEKEFKVMSQVIGAADYTTQFVVDTPHLIRDGYNFDRGFSGWHWVRGQENDRWCTDRHYGVELPAAAEKLRSPDRTVRQYLRNVSRRRSEKDYFCAQTMSFAADWLRRNHNLGPFLLYADTFDPHEPWDPPQRYVDLYDPGYEGDEIIYPAYGKCNYMTRRELKHTRALYAAELTMVDRWVGHVLDTARKLGLYDNSLIIFTTDHGFFLGENGLIGKGMNPLYGVLSHVPFIARLPGEQRGGRCQHFVQVADLLATFVDVTGAKDPGTLHGRSLRPLLEGKSLPDRACAVSSRCPLTSKRAQERVESTITDREWRLVYRGTTGKSELYHLPEDPAHERDLFRDRRDEAKRILDLYVDFLEGLGAPKEIIAGRSSLPT